jgi:acyl carrier protein
VEGPTVTESDLDKLSFEGFRGMLAKRLGKPVEKLTRDASLVDDLGIDSIRMTELFLEFQRMGVDIDHQNVWDVRTVGDAYNLYLDGS